MPQNHLLDRQPKSLRTTPMSASQQAHPLNPQWFLHLKNAIVIHYHFLPKLVKKA